MNGSILTVKNLTKYFGEGATRVNAVDNVCLTIKRGEILLIMGPSGSGKTTFLSILGGLLSADSGEVKVGGVDITRLTDKRLPDIRAKQIGFVFQDFNLLEALTVEENILLPSSLIHGDKKQAAKRCHDLINVLGLQHRKGALPSSLSGGEKQRVAIARALINEPKIILADEPTGNLDSQTGREMMMLLQDIARDKGVSILIVTHDPRVEDIADRILWLEDGKIIDRKAELHDWSKDPVCGMRVDKWRAVYVLDYQDTQYLFCTAHCKERFLSAPEVYCTQSGKNHKTPIQASPLRSQFSAEN